MDRGPLDGVRVLDLSRLLPGPFCTWLLASLGADVVVVEPPGSPDPTRGVPPIVDGRSVFHAALHRGKRNVGLDVRRSGARPALEALLSWADVLVEGFRPGVLAASGLDPRRLLERHPRLVIASITGFGQSGPLADLPGHDLNYAGYAGIVAATGGDPPFPPAVQVADLAGGALLAALGISAALFGRERTGRGRWLDISMTDGALALSAPHLAVLLAEGRDAVPGGEMLTGGLPSYRTYRCADGGLITFAPLEPKFWDAFAREIGEPGLAPDPEHLARLFATLPRDAWVERLRACCVGPALRATELPRHPHFLAREAFERVLGVEMPRAPFPWTPDRLPRRLGADTVAVLREVGVDPEPLLALGVASAPGGGT